MPTVDSEQAKAAVRETYGRIATEERSAGCCVHHPGVVGRGPEGDLERPGLLR